MERKNIMNWKRLCIGLALAAATAFAQAPASPDLKLRGDRFTPLSYDQLTPEQKAFVDQVMSEKVGLVGPYNVLLRNPALGRTVHDFSVQVRFHSSLPTKLNELSIMMAARFWNSSFVWMAHSGAGLKAGLSKATVDAIAAGERPTSLAPDEEIVYNFSNELLTTKQVSDASYKAVLDKFGEKGVVDLIGQMGYFQYLSMMLNVDRYPLPPGVAALKPLH
jgi:4-carboxymuconolactone decarboxylase